MQLSERGAIHTGPLTKSFGWDSAASFQQQDVQVCAPLLPVAPEGHRLTAPPRARQECMTVLFSFIASTCAGSAVSRVIERDFTGAVVDYLLVRGRAACMPASAPLIPPRGRGLRARRPPRWTTCASGRRSSATSPSLCGAWEAWRPAFARA